ncbi:MAG TPA: hypothetical protein VG733_13850 [Chthoniobacteraceae bacterium]|nr:hypothetical protein [Chthoniobacteraceae bacterium]
MKFFGRLIVLCRGDSEQIALWLDERDLRWLAFCAASIVAGCALYGGVVGLWRAPAQAVYTAVKMPLLVFLTCGANALLNGMLAQLLGSGLGFRQTSLAILMSFATSSVVVAALSPVSLFVCLNTPPPAAHAEHGAAHSVMILCNVVFIAYAGVVANQRLLRMLAHRCGNARVARRVFGSWLAGNLFLGAQISWILRPFIGSPLLAVQFLRDNPFHGNFYETVFNALKNTIQ